MIKYFCKFHLKSFLESYAYWSVVSFSLKVYYINHFFNPFMLGYLLSGIVQYALCFLAVINNYMFNLEFWEGPYPFNKIEALLE